MIKINEYYHLNGQLCSRTHIDMEVLSFHNSEGPAIQNWYENGQLEREEYFVNGLYSNPNGPAWSRWKINGLLDYEEFWFDGVKYKNLKEVQHAAKNVFIGIIHFTVQHNIQQPNLYF